MAREIKIGLFAIVAIVIAIVGYNFLKGKNLLDANNVFLAEYSNVDQLQISAPVLLSGLQVGMVKDIYLKKDDYSVIIVEIEVKKEIKIPKNALAQIISTGLMGGRSVNLKFEGICSGEDCAKNGDHLRGETKGFLDSMVGTDKLTQYTDTIRSGVTKILDTISVRLKRNDNEVGKSLEDLQVTLQNLRSTTTQLDQIVRSSKNEIVTTLDNLEAITATIRASNEQIKSIIDNTEKFSGQLKDVDLKNTADEARAAIANLKTTLATTDKTLAEATEMIRKIKNGEGTLGLLVSDKKLYENLQSTSKNLDLLLQDVRLNPKRYTRILSRKQIPYQAPAVDPAETGGN